ncbi:hypothetical protein BDW68DRAFT_151916, partial [Aspergillus falconensis]
MAVSYLTSNSSLSPPGLPVEMLVYPVFLRTITIQLTIMTYFRARKTTGRAENSPTPGRRDCPQD